MKFSSPATDESGSSSLSKFLNVEEASFSISLQPLLKKSLPGTLKLGCVVTFSADTLTSDQWELCNRIRLAWQKIVVDSTISRIDLLRDIEFLLTTQVDDNVHIKGSINALAKASGPLTSEHESEWFYPPETPLRFFALLRRLSLPMYRFDKANEVSFVRLDFSFLDLLLGTPSLRDLATECINRRLAQIAHVAIEYQDNDVYNHCFKQLEQLLCHALQRAGCPIRQEKYINKHTGYSSCRVPNQILSDRQAVRDERTRLLRELEERKRNPRAEVAHYTVGGEVKLPYRIRNGSLLVTEQELSHQDFCYQKRLMEKVNKTLPRQFFPGISRPRLCKVPLSGDAVLKLRSIFFDKEGALRKDIVEDVDKSSKHGFINFSNASCRDERNDYRWQVPLRQHAQYRPVVTRTKVEALFSEQGLIHSSFERIHDLGILIGGTEDQSLHHDIPRQTTAWLPVDADTDEGVQLVPVNGWEYDRAAYNEAMASSYAPSSILLGMSDEGKIKVGVQKNQIERYDCPQGWCRIVNGKVGEQFRIVRENQFLVVVEANPGAFFTGDFQHAGVRNFPPGSLEDKLMMDFYRRVEAITSEGEDNDEEHDIVMRQLLKMMCNFSDLYKICRFHCSTEPIHGPLQIPRNTVGFVECCPNPPREENSAEVAPGKDVANENPIRVQHHSPVPSFHDVP